MTVAVTEAVGKGAEAMVAEMVVEVRAGAAREEATVGRGDGGGEGGPRRRGRWSGGGEGGGDGGGGEGGGGDGGVVRVVVATAEREAEEMAVAVMARARVERLTLTRCTDSLPLTAHLSDAMSPAAASHEVSGPAPLRWPSGGMVLPTSRANGDAFAL